MAPAQKSSRRSRGRDASPRKRPARSRSRSRSRRRRAARSSSSSGSGRSLSPLPQLAGLVLRPAPGGPKDKKGDQRVAIVPRSSKRITAALITVTKNNQGEDRKAAYCLAALCGTPEGALRLIRIVPDIGHFWSDESLPAEMRDIHLRPRVALPWEPQWPFQPLVVGFEPGTGTLPDAITGPHRQDDVVARKLEYVGGVDDMDKLYEQFGRLAHTSIYDVWPQWAWATNKSLIPESDVPSLAIFHGAVVWVEWRSQQSPWVTIDVNDVKIERLPYAAHRLHDDKGFKMLEWMMDKKECLILLGLSRTFQKDNGPPQCPILILRIFPIP